MHPQWLLGLAISPLGVFYFGSLVMIKCTSTSGVYGIKCVQTYKIYIGSSIEIEKRWKVHQNRLRQNFHWNPHLQSAWNKYGELQFEWIILEKLPGEALEDGESRWFAKTNCCDPKFGFNISIDPRHCMLGRKHKESTKLKMSITAKDKQISNEYRENMSKAQRGSNHPKSFLNEGIIKEIRKDYAKMKQERVEGTRPPLGSNKSTMYDELTQKYGINKDHISDIIRRKIWRHI